MAQAVSVFISYAHEDAELARELATSLRRRRCRVWIDEGEMRLGDSLIERIATAITEVQFVVALVSRASVASRWCRKELSLAISGGLGREGVKVLPLRVGNVKMPPALSDVLWLQLDTDAVSEAAALIKRDAERHLADSRAILTRSPSTRTAHERDQVASSTRSRTRNAAEGSQGFEPIRIEGIIREGVGRARNDGTRGSALYDIPLKLSRQPPSDWATLFVRNWDHPPSWTTMHRPGICRVYGDRIILDGTTMKELEDVHLRTLRLALDATNQQYSEINAQRVEQQRRKSELEEQHRKEIDEIADRLKFDEE